MRSATAFAISTVLVLGCRYAEATHHALIVSGLGGEPTYERRFREQADALDLALRRLEDVQVVTLRGSEATRAAVRHALSSIAARATASDQFSLTLIGHGSFDGEEYRFNVPGPDVTGADLVTWLASIAAGQQLIVVATSSSGAMLPRLQRENRVVITATKSGGERNAVRFSEYWIKALTAAEADRDKNEWVTVQEAFDYAMRKVTDSFKSDAALATEHARLQGANSEQLALGRLGAAKRMPTDAELNRLFAERLRIEKEFDAIKARKPQLAADAYYDELEQVLVALAQTQRRIDARQAALAGAER